MAYTKTVWENGSSAVNATNMNHIEQGIYDNSLIAGTVGDITNLTTNNKTNVVSAINELKNAEIYSATETKTNKVWINNKPIYRKVISGTLPSISGSGVVNTNIAHNISDFDLCTNISGYFTQLASPDYKPMLPILSNSGKVTAVAQVTSTNVVIRSNNESWASNAWDYTIVIEYTKTTD